MPPGLPTNSMAAGKCGARSWRLPRPLVMRCKREALRRRGAPQSRGEVRVHGDRVLVEAELTAENPVRGVGRRLPPASKMLRTALADFIRYVADIELLRGARVRCRAGFRRDASHGCHQLRNFARDPLHGADPLGRASQGVVTQRHRSRAGVIGRAFEVKHQPALSGDGFDDAERQAEMVQHRALFDVKLQSIHNSTSPSGLGYASRVEDRNRARRRRCGRSACVQTAHRGAAPDERDAVAYAFFFGEADQFDGIRQGTGPQIFEQRYPDQNAEIRRKRPRWNRIEVRSDDEEGLRPSAARVARKLPTASMYAAQPASESQPARSACTSFIGGER